MKKEDKIDEDEIEWLVSVYNSDIDEEVTKEAYEKLIEYGLTDKQIEDVFEKTKSNEPNLKGLGKLCAKQEEKNEFEKYTLIEMIKVFLLGPYELFHSFNGGLRELWDYNYKTKFRQRLILLILGTIFWILFVVGTFKYYEYKRIKKIENTEISGWETQEATFSKTETMSISQHENSQQEMLVNQNSLEDVIIKTIKAYQTQNEKTLNKLILKDFGIIFIHRPGVMDDFIFSDKISFENPTPEYYPYEIDFKIEYVISFEKLPEFSCETEKWNKPFGIYCDTIYRSKQLSTIAKFRNKYFEDNFSTTKIEKFEAIEKTSHKVIVLGKNGTYFKFYLTLKENKWHLTIIDRTDYCSA